jgi:hypothetical protein
MRFVVFCLSIGLVCPCSAQLIPDSVILKKSRENAMTLYHRTLEGNLRVYNGPEYTLYQSTENEHPYFLTDRWAIGNVVYERESYSDIPLLFDIEKNLLVVFSPFKGVYLKLTSERVQSFDILGHHFVKRIQPHDSVDRQAFYDVVYSGKTTLLCLHNKVYSEKIEEKRLLKSFIETNKYYIVKHGEYIKIRNKKTAMRALLDKKAALKTFIKKSNLTRENQEAFLKGVVSYYDSLTP